MQFNHLTNGGSVASITCAKSGLPRDLSRTNLGNPQAFLCTATICEDQDEDSSGLTFDAKYFDTCRISRPLCRYVKARIRMIVA